MSATFQQSVVSVISINHIKFSRKNNEIREYDDFLKFSLLNLLREDHKHFMFVNRLL